MSDLRELNATHAIIRYTKTHGTGPYNFQKLAKTTGLTDDPEFLRRFSK